MNTFNLARDMKISAKAADAEEKGNPACPQCGGIGIEDRLGTASKCRRCGGSGTSRSGAAKPAEQPAAPKPAEKLAAKGAHGADDDSDYDMSVSPSSIGFEATGDDQPSPPPKDGGAPRLKRDIGWLLSSMPDEKIAKVFEHFADRNGLTPAQRTAMTLGPDNSLKTSEVLLYVAAETEKLDEESLKSLYGIIRGME